MSVVRNEPDMNMAKQINAALNDIRLTMVSHNENMEEMARFQLDCALEMIRNHHSGKRSTPWSDVRYRVIEEFS